MKMKAFAHTRRRFVLLATLTFSVIALTGINPVWAAGITYSPHNPLVGQTVTFTGYCSLPPCEAYGWSFGDGTTGQGSPVYHAYSAAGTYHVHLTVVNSNGDLDGAGANAYVTVTGIYVVGHVYDNSNSPIAGATVDLRTQDGNTLLGRVSTDSNGYYQIGGSNSGTYQVNATKAYYWEERQYVTVSCLGCTGTGDFHLPGDLFYPIANLVVMFATVNKQQTRADLSWSLSAGSTVEVDGYVNPIGGNFQVSVDTTVSGSDNTVSSPGLTSLLYQRGVEVHGVFWKQDPSHPMGVWVVAQQNVFGQNNSTPDYMTSPPPSGGSLQNVPGGASISYTYTQSASVSLRFEEGVDVSVTLEGVGFSTKLASILTQGGVNVQRSMTIQITNIDGWWTTHSYYYYFEGNGILHVWQTN